MPSPSGVLVVDKPRGPTSHDVVAIVRRRLRSREVGHAGTLDPMATGVLVLAIGEATKLVSWLTAHDKAYETTIALGDETDTLDAEGTVVRSVRPSDDLLAALGASGGGAVSPLLRAAIERERERTSQVPPAYSAIKTSGERAFARARRGEAVDLAARAVRAHAIDVLGCAVEPPALTLSLTVEKGYYVRALARDLAEALGTAGHLTALRRVRSGPFLVDEALSFDAAPDAMIARLLPVAVAAARALPVARLTEAGVRDARCGRVVQPSDIAGEANGASAWLEPSGGLVAVGAIDETGCGRVTRGFTGT